jgi:hypothetical protein
LIFFTYSQGRPRGSTLASKLAKLKQQQLLKESGNGPVDQSASSSDKTVISLNASSILKIPAYSNGGRGRRRKLRAVPPSDTVVAQPREPTSTPENPTQRAGVEYFIQTADSKEPLNNIVVDSCQDNQQSFTIPPQIQYFDKISSKPQNFDSVPSEPYMNYVMPFFNPNPDYIAHDEQYYMNFSHEYPGSVVATAAESASGVATYLPTSCNHIVFGGIDGDIETQMHTTGGIHPASFGGTINHYDMRLEDRNQTQNPYPCDSGSVAYSSQCGDNCDSVGEVSGYQNSYYTYDREFSATGTSTSNNGKGSGKLLGVKRRHSSRDPKSKDPMKSVEKKPIIRGKHRPNFSAEIVHMLIQWFEANLDNPYPSQEVKNSFAESTGLSLKQV